MDCSADGYFCNPGHAVVENQAPNTDIEVIPSDANALVLMDVRGRVACRRAG